MKRKSGIFCRSMGVLAIVIAVFALSAVGQAPGRPSGNETPPPPGWAEKWMGMYAQQDSQGKIAPPGFKVLVIPELNEREKSVPHEPDVVDVVKPLLQPWALARAEAADYELEDSGQICRPTGLLRPIMTTPFQLVVSPEKITVVNTATGGGINTAGFRRIYLNRPHSKNPPLTYLGDSVGHWEGDTLVIDTIGFNTKTWLSREGAPHSEALHIVERWRFVANGEWLEKTITVDDRFALTEPYTMTRYHKKLPPDTPALGTLCQDTPESRKAWVKIYKRALTDWEETRKSLNTGGKKVELQ